MIHQEGRNRVPRLTLSQYQHSSSQQAPVLTKWNWQEVNEARWGRRLPYLGRIGSSNPGKGSLRFFSLSLSSSALAGSTLSPAASPSGTLTTVWKLGPAEADRSPQGSSTCTGTVPRMEALIYAQAIPRSELVSRLRCGIRTVS